MKKLEKNESNYSKYKKLKPKYNFVIKGNVAVGTLPDGTKFKIDSDKIDLVSNYHFHLNWKGYIYCIRKKNEGGNLKLHWLVLGYTSRPNFIVDHINRDITDCRADNLRLVTIQQNSMNRKVGTRNKTGYLGVHINKQLGKYSSRICINDRRINLIHSNDLVLCAQAYNYASQLLFRDFCGYRNPVPEPSLELKKLVEEKCRKYQRMADVATRNVDKEGA